jgi:hypothetical protein
LSGNGFGVARSETVENTEMSGDYVLKIEADVPNVLKTMMTLVRQQIEHYRSYNFVGKQVQF